MGFLGQLFTPLKWVVGAVEAFFKRVGKPGKTVNGCVCRSMGEKQGQRRSESERRCSGTAMLRLLRMLALPCGSGLQLY